MKIVKRNQLNQIILNIKAAGKTLVFTNGCFDILHVGHVRYLTAAKELGDCLIVGLNSDESVRCLKGPTRPINHEDDRAEVLAALSCVDYVILFGEHTAEGLIAEIKPDIYVKGGDYRIDELPEVKIVTQYGGRIELIPEVPGRSSSNVIKKIKEENS
ncbi:D-beta-D-heptose 1-phosphate adenylyltransferase [bioreactor metagenome]|uniref:D-glycero-beta-D-manno-heptose 1-phosphate adenylyltransferase n=1 Tax=bioreactor metagenome TaxID=1076179 RepID=A0A644TPI7_9ZZZZ